jgi:hypothetical protein
MSDDFKPPARRGDDRRTRKAANAYKAAKTLAAQAWHPAMKLGPTRRKRKGQAAADGRVDQPGTHQGVGGRSRERAGARDPGPQLGKRRGPVGFGFLFGFGFAAGTALFRLILILIFYGMLGAFGYWAYTSFLGL